MRRNLIEEFGSLTEQARKMLNLTYKAFYHHNLKYIEEAQEIGKEIDNREKELTSLLIKKENIDDKIETFITIPSHIERIGDSLESILHSTSTKITKGILFSDKAVNEITYLFNKLNELSQCTIDCILTKNKILVKYIIEECKNLSNKANEFADEHEKRLVTGVCLPQSAPIYLDILDSLKNICWHIRKIAEIISVTAQNIEE